MISCDHLRWSAGRFTLALDVRLEHRVTGIFGVSGSGKTTLIELLAGLRRPTSGILRIDGETLHDTVASFHVRPEHRHVGYVPQDGALFPHLNVEQNIRYGQPRGLQTDPRFSIDHICEFLGINLLRTSRVTGLSGGERQRIALARALLSHPRLLLLDEPLASLDASRKETILPYLRRVRDEFGLPMLYVSHAPEELVALCDEVLVLDAGRLVTRGPPSEIFETFTAPRHRLRRNGDVPVAGSLDSHAIPIVIPQ